MIWPDLTGERPVSLDSGRGNDAPDAAKVCDGTEAAPHVVLERQAGRDLRIEWRPGPGAALGDGPGVV